MYDSSATRPVTPYYALQAAEHNRDAAVYWHGQAEELRRENESLKSAIATMAMQLDQMRRQLEYLGGRPY